jgi:hypothetical protein
LCFHIISYWWSVVSGQWSGPHAKAAKAAKEGRGNQIVLVVVLVLLIEGRGIEDEHDDEDEDEHCSPSAKGG